MATFDYSNIKDYTVITNLTRFGNTVTMTRYETTDTWEKKFDSITSRVYWENITTHEIVYTDPTGTPTIYTSVGVLTAYKQKEIDGTLIKQGDMKLLTVDLPNGNAGDKYTINSEIWSYVDSEKVSPDNVTTVLQKIQVRK